MKMKNITDDVWFEIFLNLPLDSIYKFRCVCKVWLSILSCPNFIKEWYKLNNLSLPWALLGHYRITVQRVSSSDKILAYPDSHSRFLSLHQKRFSFRFSNDTKVYLLGSGNGLFLCGTDFLHKITYYVCNPLTKKRVFLPPSPRGINVALTGFMCNDGCFSVSASYKVIRIPIFEAATKEFKVQIFSSDLGKWSICDVSCPEYVTWDYAIYDNLITCNGVFYWFQKKSNKILAVCLDGNANGGMCGNECRLIIIPNQPDNSRNFFRRCLGESEGLICYASYKEAERSLSVWVLDGGWNVLCKDIMLHDMLTEIEELVIGGEGSIYFVQVLGFNPFDKHVVLLGYKEFIWAFNTRTKGYEQLCRSSFLGNFVFTAACASVLAFSAKPRPTIIPPVCRSL